MMQWETVEKCLPPLRTQKEKRQLSHKIKMITIILMIVSLSMLIKCEKLEREKHKTLHFVYFFFVQEYS